MLYHLFDYLNGIIDLPGSGLMRYISFRSVMAVVTALLFVIYCGKGIIRALQRHQIGESIRPRLGGTAREEGHPYDGRSYHPIGNYHPRSALCASRQHLHPTAACGYHMVRSARLPR